MPKTTTKKGKKQINHKSILLIVVLFLSSFAIVISFGTLAYAVQNNISSSSSNDIVYDFDAKIANISKAETTGDAKVISNTKVNEKEIGVFEVQLTSPGDSVKYTLEIQNRGNIDASIVLFSKGTPTCQAIADDDTRNEEQKNADATLVCGNLDYYITYSDGTPVAKGDVISSRTTKKVIVKVAYKANSQKATDAVRVTVPSTLFELK